MRNLIQRQRMKHLSSVWVIPMSLFAALVAAQQTDINYDESKVLPYTLPDPLVGADGTRVTTASDWNSKRRREILRLFETEVYGRTPARQTKVQFHLNETDPHALQGLATRKQISVALSD